MVVQQYRLRSIGHPDSQSYRRILRRLSTRATFSSLRHELDADYQRGRHHSEQICRIRIGERRDQESAMGFADAEHHRRRSAVYECTRHREMGCPALYRATLEEIESRADVDTSNF